VERYLSARLWGHTHLAALRSIHNHARHVFSQNLWQLQWDGCKALNSSKGRCRRRRATDQRCGRAATGSANPMQRRPWSAARDAARQHQRHGQHMRYSSCLCSLSASSCKREEEGQQDESSSATAQDCFTRSASKFMPAGGCQMRCPDLQEVPVGTHHSPVLPDAAAASINTCWGGRGLVNSAVSGQAERAPQGPPGRDSSVIAPDWACARVAASQCAQPARR
jgi:hypothetical protein